MEGFLRSVLIILFYLFFIFIFGLIGLLFDLHDGFFWGSGIAALILFILFKYGEKIILLMAKARYVTDDELLVNQVKNLCTHLDISDIKVYWSSVYINNVYFINSYGGTPSIIVGKNVFQSLTKNELNSLIHATLLRIKSIESKHRSAINLILYVIFSWVFLFEKLVNNEEMKRILEVFLYPPFYFKSLFYKLSNDYKYFDVEIFKHDNLKRDYVSALFKVNNMKVCYPLSAGAFVLSGLSHTYNITDNVLFYILIINETPIEERVKNITGNF